MINLARFDPHLLYIFYILYQEKNASRAAERLMISQPGLAHKLNKLRQEWKDPLFIKSSKGLTPTPKAHLLAPKVTKLIHHLDIFYQEIFEKDFLTRHEKIVLYTTDYMEQKLLPSLLYMLQEKAPNITIITRNTQGKLPKNELENGECDLAIAGFYKNLPDTFRQQKLFEEPFVVLCRKNNPEIKGELTLDNYLSSKHIVTTLNGDLFSLIDKELAKHNQKRNIIAGVSSFLSTIEIVRHNDFLVTCLKSIATLVTDANPELIYYPLPIEVKPVEMMQIWHERTHEDPLRSWLRQAIKLKLSEEII
ncbi:LysR family transcriptional regulator [Thorsellia anophelis]|uniref:DNA-binding transcriptional regulator, LysR family n=1 Tax=Thorsellia anophelis DSM 18579 TaxID=1123402 RepID=A0A1H9Y7W9_9GAMM|nr:LysR family transcriptional regulator [Thorsellia anophelis]SES65038.1 DNA-binding transcriptional regulator, LysR family [Thorsellia anophelis DSM 18579]